MPTRAEEAIQSAFLRGRRAIARAHLSHPAGAEVDLRFVAAVLQHKDEVEREHSTLNNLAVVLILWTGSKTQVEVITRAPEVYAALGRTDDAAALLDATRTAQVEAGELWYEACVLRRIGSLTAQTGRTCEAIDAWRAAATATTTL